MNLITIKIEEIQEAPFNYNLHPQNQLDELCKSLQEFGQFKNIVLWHGYCIAGNGLVFAASSLKWRSLEAIIRDDLTEEQAKRLCIADNATPYLAQPDLQKLDGLLQTSSSDLPIPGVTDDWLHNFFRTIPEIIFDEDAKNTAGGAWSQPSNTIVFWIYDRKFQTTEEMHCQFIMTNKEELDSIENDKLVSIVMEGLYEILST